MSAWTSARTSFLLVLGGLPIGFAGSLCGIGGGLFAGPLLIYLFGFELRRATGTALVLVFGTTAAATATETFLADSALRWGVVGALILGVLLGAQLGFAFSERVPERVLRAIFAVALLAASVRVLSAPTAAPDAGQAALALGAPDLVWSGLVGLAGGFLAPVLGVGGGLVMVPGLFLGVGGLGFDGARACSLAAGALGAARSLALKSKAGRVSWRHGIPLGAGALAGAVAGVVLLDREERLLEAGRIVLGLLLAVVALRFARDALRARFS